MQHPAEIKREILELERKWNAIYDILCLTSTYNWIPTGIFSNFQTVDLSFHWFYIFIHTPSSSPTTILDLTWLDLTWLDTRLCPENSRILSYYGNDGIRLLLVECCWDYSTRRTADRHSTKADMIWRCFVLIRKHTAVRWYRYNLLRDPERCMERSRRGRYPALRYIPGYESYGTVPVPYKKPVARPRPLAEKKHRLNQEKILYGTPHWKIWKYLIRYIFLGGAMDNWKY